MTAISLSSAAALWFEDFVVGAEIWSTPKTLSEESIIDFARQYDPQYFHVDREAAAQSIYGGLIASGWQTTALCMRMICDTYLGRAQGASMGSPGIDAIRWLKPVRPGDHLRLKTTVLESRASESKRDRGIVRQRWEVFNQANELVMTLEGVNLFRRRPA